MFQGKRLKAFLCSIYIKFDKIVDAMLQNLIREKTLVTNRHTQYITDCVYLIEILLSRGTKM